METSKKSPPIPREKILRWIIPSDEAEALLGDFEEIYEEIGDQKGRFAAGRWYWIQILRLLPSFIKNMIYWSAEMLKNYLKVALRNIKRNKLFSVVNLLGLAVGMGCCFLIFLYVQHELSYDRFHEKTDRIYRVVTEWKVEGGSRIHQTTVAPIAPALLNDYPEVQKAVRIRRTGAVVRFGEKSYVEGGVSLVDPSFLEFFHFPLVRGNPKTVLNSLNSIVITEEMAEKYFGSRDPMGQRITLWNDHDFEVTGIARNVPQNTHLDFDFLVRFELVNSLSNYNYLGSWGSWNFYTYILIQKDYSIPEFEGKTTDFLKKYRGADSTNPQRLGLLPLTRINLETYGKLKYIYLFTAIAVVILMLACINFMNLSIARSTIRVREIGMRKVIGARRPQLIQQFLGECLVLALLALPAAIILVHVFLPSVNTLLMTDLQPDYLKNYGFILGMIGITFLVALFSGAYPSLYLSAFQPVRSLRGELNSGSRGTGLKSLLVVFQFTVAVILILSNLTIRNQMRFIQKKNLGFKKDFVVNVPIRADELRRKGELIKSELSRSPGILGTTVSSFSPGSYPNQSVSWEGQKDDEELMMPWYAVDHDFIRTFEIEILEGRDFSREFPSDVKAAYILNEAAVKAFAWEEPIGKQFQVQMAGLSMGTVVGVMKDFHFASLHEDIRPLALILFPRMGSTCSVKIDSQDVSGTLSFMEKTFKKFAPHMPYSYSFMDEDVAGMYVAEDRLEKLFEAFSVIALFIACMGLLGIASFSIIRRTKEIGIRKVLGASVPGIILNLSREYTKWVVAANIIAWPAAYFIMNKWLQNFAYRSGMSIWVFVVSALVVLLTAVVTVSFQAIRAAAANPAESLRYE